MHEVLVNCLGGLSLPRKSVVRLTDHPDMTIDVYLGCKTTTQQHNDTCCISGTVVVDRVETLTADYLTDHQLETRMTLTEVS